jgi:SNF2 family DNA or RNA helicase
MTEVQRTRHDELKQPIAELVARIQQRTMASGEFVRLMQLLTLQRMICNGMAQVQFDQEWARCQNTTATPALLETLFSPKLSVLRGLIEQVVIEQRRKVVVFSQWRKLLCLAEWAVRDVLAEHGLRALFFTGAESVSARERAIAEFHEDPSASVLFASDAGATGLNLQRAASCCINMELPWNPALLAQRIARIHRLGQTQPIDVYNLVAEDGIEGRIAQLLERKQAIFSSLFDGTSDEVVLDGSGGNPILDSVAQLVDGLPLAVASESSSDLEPSVDLEASAAVSEALPEAPDATPAIQPTLTALEQVGLRLTTMVDGSLRIEAPPGLAAELTELLRTFAKSKRSN